MKETEVLKSLVKIGRWSDWLGLFSGYSLRKVADIADLWGFTGSLWKKESLEAAISPYREYAIKQGLSERAISEELQYFASKVGLDPNRAKRIYYQIEVEPTELEELAEEAEAEVPEESEEETEEEETEEETEPEEEAGEETEEQ